MTSEQIRCTQTVRTKRRLRSDSVALPVALVQLADKLRLEIFQAPGRENEIQIEKKTYMFIFLYFAAIESWETKVIANRCF